jgi:hypothetical protein
MVSVPVLSHHSTGAYDLNRSMTAPAVLKSFAWENPHIYFDFEAQNPDGTTTKWHIEAGPPIMFIRGGYKASDFKKGVGTTVTMTWCPTRSDVRHDGARLGYWHAIRFADGSEIVEQDVLKLPRLPPGKC